mgnify:FL=1
MAKHIKDIEKTYDILIACRQVFRDLNGDSLVALKKMERLCEEIDELIEEKKHEEKYE